MIAWITILFTACYALLFFYYWVGWTDTPFFSGKTFGPVMFTVIIPARNEEKNIGQLLESILDQDLPREYYEIIVVDDHSEDNTAGIASSYGVKVIAAPSADNSFKKKAIWSAIEIAKGDYIVTTDADCRVGASWLSTIASFIEKHQPVLIAAPVDLRGNGSILHSFQELDFAMMQGITCASITQKLHAMGNGANLIYSRATFKEVGGFEGIDRIASGDDMLLVERIQKKYPDNILYLRSNASIVVSEPQNSWKDLLNQRIRWGSKSSHYKDVLLTSILSFVYLYNLWLLTMAFLAAFDIITWEFVLIALIAKILIELPLMMSVLDFFRKPRKVAVFPFLQPMHILYIVVAGLFSLRKTYVWKGRRVR